MEVLLLLHSILFNFGFFFQARWCLSPVLMGRTLIQTTEGYRTRVSACPALRGSSAGTQHALPFFSCMLRDIQYTPNQYYISGTQRRHSEANTHLCLDYAHN